MKLATLIHDVGLPVELHGEDNVDLVDVRIDSRDVHRGDLFVALRGANADGHKFLEAAIRNGAVAVVVETDYAHPDVSVVRVPDTRAYLAKLARVFFGDPTGEVPVIGITGTNGKTTTAAMIEHLMNVNGKSVGVFGTLNIRWPGHAIETPNTTPESVDVQRYARRMVDDGVDAIVMEVSSHALANHRVDGVTFHTTLFTNLSRDHLNFHGSMDNYFLAKRRLFSDFPSRRIVNVDDERGAMIAEAFDALAFGEAGDADVVVKNIETSTDGSKFVLADGKTERGYSISMLGRYNVQNAVGAILACESVTALTTFDGAFVAPGRMEQVAPRVLVDYAHTPDALSTVLQTLQQVTEGRVIVVFGCGGERDRGKRPEMGRVASRWADVVWVTSDNPRGESPQAIIDEIAVGVPDAILEVDRADAIHGALAQKGPDDVVLIAGKGHEPYQEIGGTRIPFSDKEVVEAYYE